MLVFYYDFKMLCEVIEIKFIFVDKFLFLFYGLSAVTEEASISLDF